jgi:DNA-directed RNA polymerase specialized sigma24 family protein
MIHQTDLQLLTLAGIAHRCARETELFFQRQSYDPRYCFELFRRAIIEHSHRAWEFVYDQYRPLVARWVKRHSAFQNSGEEAQYFVNRAFEKMWTALNPDKLDEFPDLKSLLRYLQLCVHSVILDQVRLAEQAEVGVRDDVASIIDNRASGPNPEDQIMARVRQQEFWEEISARLRSEKESRVVYASFVLGLKPGEIYAHFRETFRDVKEVYRVKENVLARLGRDSELKKFIGEDA